MLDDNFTKKYPDIEELRRLLLVLKNNKDHIPVSVLKSKYKKGYNDLCDKIRHSASAYALNASLHGLTVHISYADEIATIVTSVIEGSGIMHQFSTAIYKNQDLDQADREASGNDSHLSIRLPGCRNRCRYVTQ